MCCIEKYTSRLFCLSLKDSSENITEKGVDVFKRGTHISTFSRGGTQILPIFKGWFPDSANPQRVGTQILPNINYQKFENSSNKATEHI